MYNTSVSLTSALDGGRWSTPRPDSFSSRERDPVAIVEEIVWDPGPVWTGAENLDPTGIRSSDRPARSEPLYALSYPGSPKTDIISTKLHCVTSRKS